MGTILRLIKLVVTVSAILLIIGTLGIGSVYFYFAHDLPNIRSFEDYKPPIVSEVFAEDGTKMGEFWIEQRYLTKINEIPKVIIQSFIAAEDSRFFEHKGVDVRGIGRAFYENLKAGHIVQGGSTITQQITRSILLSRERSYIRKIKEAILATRIDRNLSKREILEIYLNQIYLGNRAYGVKAAAQNYYHKDLNDLTLAEASMLGGLTQAPSTDNPVTSPKQARERQMYVLQRMVDVGYITKQQMKDALNETLTIYEAGLDKDFNFQQAPYFTEHVRRMVLETYGDKKVYEGGLKIYTTADITMNHVAQKAVRFGVEALDHRQGFRGPVGHLTEDEIPAFIEKVHNDNAEKVTHIPEIKADQELKTGPTPLSKDKFYEAVFDGVEARNLVVRVGHNRGTISPKDYQWAAGVGSFKKGDIIMVQPLEVDGTFALVQIPKVQGALFSMVPATGFVRAMSGGFDFELSEFDRATQALRQPGSSFKPIIYSSAMDKGYTYDTPVADSPVSYKVGDEIWTPKNYGGKFAGLTEFWSNLIYSRNVPTVKIASTVGTHYIVAYARKMGLTNYFYKYLSMALGANSVYLHEMVTAFCTFPNYGRKPDRIFITKIIDADGRVLEEYTPPPPVMDPNEAYRFSLSVGPESTELNTALFEANKQFIEKDGLKLSDEELRILYGRAIPDGYIMTPQTAYLILNAMREVVKRGTAVRVQALGRPVAGKTGTTNDETDAWFIGYVPQLAAGAWIGFDVKKPMGRGEQGGRTAAPIFIEYMKEVLKDMEPLDFQPPESFPVAEIAELKGGSAIYCTGLNKGETAGGTWLGVTHSVRDRAVDFFEEDMGL